VYKENTLLQKLTSFATFALIPLFAFVTVLLIPFLTGLFLTFTDWDGLSSIASLDYNWAGLENYTQSLADANFWTALSLTFLYTILVVILTNVAALLIALLVTSGLKGRNFFRSVFFVPNLIGGVILGFIWQFIFSGLVVYLGSVTKLEVLQFSWLVDTTKAFIALVVVSVWQLSGYMMLVYIAGLIRIPHDVIEASSIDGANGIQQLLHIKLPLMVQAFTISLFLTLRNSFMVYDVNLALTGGGPFRTTELISMHIYNEAFRFQNYGTGQAKAVMLFIIVAIVAVAQVVITKRMEVEA
jgi:raffinose/stachyose/melibiose transport system permease protein